MKQTVKDLRQKLDAIQLETSNSLNLPGGREQALYLTHLEQGRMLLGKLLGFFGEANPYTTDIAELGADIPGEGVEYLYNLREALNDVITQVEFLLTHLPDQGLLVYQAYASGAIVELTLAKNWIGVLAGKSERAQIPQTPLSSPASTGTESSTAGTVKQMSPSSAAGAKGSKPSSGADLAAAIAPGTPSKGIAEDPNVKATGSGSTPPPSTSKSPNPGAATGTKEYETNLPKE